MMRNVLFAAALSLAIASGACGGKAVFSLSAEDNNAAALDRALARRALPAQARPVNASGQPRVFAVTSARGIVAFDLAGDRALWTATADVQSRLVVGGDFVVAREGAAIVARDQATGKVRWSSALRGELIGIAADASRAYVVSQAGDAAYVVALDGRDGATRWSNEARGRGGGQPALGAPAAHGGVVYVPYLSQWLAILDGASGAALTRVRGIDEEIGTVRATSTAAYFGSKQGVFRLDRRSATGTRAGASYRQVAIPGELERTSYGRDVYDATQASYGAGDRARVVWTSLPTASGPLQLDGGYAIHYLRFVFGFDEGGALRWAYSQPRVDLVAVEDTGRAIVGVSSAGEVVALDRATGAVRARASLGRGVSLIGAALDVDGWAPAPASPEGEPLVTSLGNIARDRDARIDGVKQLAVRALAERPGGEATAALLAVMSDERASPAIQDLASSSVASRRDPASVEVLVAALAMRDDEDGIPKPPSSLGVAARAIARSATGEGAAAIDPAVRDRAVVALRGYLATPGVAVADLVDAIAAAVALGGPSVQLALAAHFALYHADDELGEDPSWQQAIVRALDPQQPTSRAVLEQAVRDPRTQPGLAARAKAALAK